MPRLAPGKSRMARVVAAISLCELVDRADEAPLAGMRRGAAETAVRIEHGSSVSPMPLTSAAARNPRRHLGRIGIGRAVAVMMQIVELADAGETRFQHLDIEQRRDRLDIFGRHRRARSGTSSRARSRSCLRVSPRISARPGHAALEGVAVQVRHARDADRMALVAGCRRQRPLVTARDGSVGHRQRARRPPSRTASSADREMQRGSCFQTRLDTASCRINMSRHISPASSFRVLSGNVRRHGRALRYDLAQCPARDAARGLPGLGLDRAMA